MRLCVCKTLAWKDWLEQRKTALLHIYIYSCYGKYRRCCGKAQLWSTLSRDYRCEILMQSVMLKDNFEFWCNGVHSLFSDYRIHIPLGKYLQSRDSFDYTTKAHNKSLPYLITPCSSIFYWGRRINIKGSNKSNKMNFTRLLHEWKFGVKYSLII